VVSCSGTPRHLARRRSPGIEPATFLAPELLPLPKLEKRSLVSSHIMSRETAIANFNVLIPVVPRAQTLFHLCHYGVSYDEKVVPRAPRLPALPLAPRRRHAVQEPSVRFRPVRLRDPGLPGWEAGRTGDVPVGVQGERRSERHTHRDTHTDTDTHTRTHTPIISLGWKINTESTLVFSYISMSLTMSQSVSVPLKLIHVLGFCASCWTLALLLNTCLCCLLSPVIV